MWVLLPTPMGPHLQVLLNVLAVIGDTTGCDAGLPHQLKADLATQVVGYISLLQHRVRSGAGKGHCSDSCYPQTPEDRQLTFLFSSTWEKSSSMSAKYTCPAKNQAAMFVGLTPHLPSPGTETHRPSRSQGHLTSITRMQIHTGPTLGLGHPHMLGLNAGLLGPEVAIVLITLMVPLTLFQLPGG